MMIPTNKLRFVERQITVPTQEHLYFAEVKKIRVLQQWIQNYESGEWKDVPLEEEK